MSSTEHIYAQAGLGGSLRWGDHPAVVVVDLTYGFTDSKYMLGAELDTVVEATFRVLEVARRGSVPVCFTRIAFTEEDLASSIWLSKSPSLAELRVGTRSTEIDDRLQKLPTEPVVTKQSPSALFETRLEALLRSWDADTVVLCGATTSGCVRATAVDLMQLGFPTLIPESCTGDRAAEAHRASLVDLQAKYADVVGLEDCLQYIDRIATSRQRLFNE